MAENTHAVLTGPITGLITLDDGTVMDVSPSVIYAATQDQAADAADKISKFYESNGHPDDIEVDEESGKLVQRKFVYDRPATQVPRKKKG